MSGLCAGGGAEGHGAGVRGLGAGMGGGEIPRWPLRGAERAGHPVAGGARLLADARGGRRARRGARRRGGQGLLADDDRPRARPDPGGVARGRRGARRVLSNVHAEPERWRGKLRHGGMADRAQPVLGDWPGAGRHDLRRRQARGRREERPRPVRRRGRRLSANRAQGRTGRGGQLCRDQRIAAGGAAATGAAGTAGARR